MKHDFKSQLILETWEFKLQLILGMNFYDISIDSLIEIVKYVDTKDAVSLFSTCQDLRKLYIHIIPFITVNNDIDVAFYSHIRFFL